MADCPDKFLIELVRNPNDWWWAFVIIGGRAIAAGFSKDRSEAIADVLRIAERHGWQNPWRLAINPTMPTSTPMAWEEF